MLYYYSRDDRFENFISLFKEMIDAYTDKCLKHQQDSLRNKIKDEIKRTQEKIDREKEKIDINHIKHVDLDKKCSCKKQDYKEPIQQKFGVNKEAREQYKKYKYDNELTMLIEEFNDIKREYTKIFSTLPLLSDTPKPEADVINTCLCSLHTTLKLLQLHKQMLHQK